jgi:predicted CoA-binding protein
MMTTAPAVDDFLAQRTLAVVGVSREGKKFGNMAYRELKAKGYQLFPINPNADSIEGDRCYPSLTALPGPVDGVLIVVPPAETERVVRDVAAAKIRRVWMQQGAESEAAIRFCQQNGINVVHNECILMFAEPTAFGHRMHRWVWGLLGKLPR